MRIGIDCRSLQEVDPSGVSWYAYFVIEQLIISFPQHEYILTTVGNPAHFAGTLASRAKEEWTGSNVSWNQIALPKKFITFATALGLFRSWKKLFGECDVMWLPNLHFFPHTKPPVPTVLTIHDLSFERYPEYLSLKGRLWHRRILRPRNLIERMSSIVCVSKHTKEEMKRVYNVAEDRCMVVYPGVRMPHTPPPLVTRDADAPFTICVISTIEPRKNIFIITQVVPLLRAKYPDIRCRVIGKPGYHSAEVIAEMKSAGIEYDGYVSQEEKYRILKESDVMVYPSIYEGFGLPPLEAQAVGIPVIAGAHTSLPEVVGESALLCDMNDAHSLCAALEVLIQHPERCAELRMKGLANAKRFSWKQSALNMMNVLQSLV